jgi:colanic acid biosynthesis glycosyl transferase WcaI
MAQTVVQALAARHQVTVLCGRPSYDPSERRAWQVYRTEQIGGDVRVIRVGSTDYPRTQMKRRVANYLSYVLLAVPRALFVKCDVVLAMTDPPFEGIVGALVAMLKGKPYVYNIRDLYPDMAVGGSIVEPGRLARLWEKLHRWALRRATKVIVLGEDMRRRILSKGVNAGKVVVVRDGAEISEPTAQGLDEEVIGKIRNGFRFVLVHAGNLGFYGAWETLLEAAEKLADDGVGLVFVGDGAQKEKVQTAAAAATNVRFLPFFPSSKVASVLAAGDAHVITVKRGLEGVVVPSKLYGILAAGKPIAALAAAECDAVALGKEKGFGAAADPENADAFAECIRELMADPNRVRKMGLAAAAVAPEFDRGKELGKLVAEVESSVYDHVSTGARHGN